MKLLYMEKKNGYFIIFSGGGVGFFNEDFGASSSFYKRFIKALNDFGFYLYNENSDED